MPYIEGESLRHATRGSAIRRYVATAVELGWRPGGEEPTEQLAVQMAERQRPVPEPRGLGKLSGGCFPAGQDQGAAMTPLRALRIRAR